MDETPSLFQPSFNASVHVETRAERLSGDGGFLLLRETPDETGLFDHPVCSIRAIRLGVEMA